MHCVSNFVLLFVWPYSSLNCKEKYFESLFWLFLELCFFCLSFISTFGCVMFVWIFYDTSFLRLLSTSGWKVFRTLLLWQRQSFPSLLSLDFPTCLLVTSLAGYSSSMIWDEWVCLRMKQLDRIADLISCPNQGRAVFQHWLASLTRLTRLSGLWTLLSSTWAID